MNAALADCPELVSSLIENNASVDMQDKDGMTALMHAAAAGHAEVTKRLLKANADVKAQNSSDLNAFDICRSAECRVMLARALGCPEGVLDGLEEKRDFAVACKEEADKYYSIAISSTHEDLIADSLSEAIRFYSLAVQCEPQNPSIVAYLEGALDYQRKVHVLLKSVTSQQAGIGSSTHRQQPHSKRESFAESKCNTARRELKKQLPQLP